MQKIKVLCMLLLLLSLISNASIYADGHIAIKQTITYMGRTFPPRSTDVWIGDNSYTVKSDLGVIWTINTASNKYYEEPVNNSSDNDVKKEETGSIHKLGKNYIPEYTWTVKPDASTEDIGGFDCKKISINGDADYAEMELNVWVTDKTPFKNNDLIKKVLNTLSDENWKDICKLRPDLSGCFVIKSIARSINAIAPDRITEKIMTIKENDTPPANIYILPEKCIKANSVDDLYN